MKLVQITKVFKQCSFKYTVEPVHNCHRTLKLGS